MFGLFIMVQFIKSALCLLGLFWPHVFCRVVKAFAWWLCSHYYMDKQVLFIRFKQKSTYHIYLLLLESVHFGRLFKQKSFLICTQYLVQLGIFKHSSQLSPTFFSSITFNGAFTSPFLYCSQVLLLLWMCSSVEALNPQFWIHVRSFQWILSISGILHGVHQKLLFSFLLLLSVICISGWIELLILLANTFLSPSSLNLFQVFSYQIKYLTSSLASHPHCSLEENFQSSM